MIIYLMNTDVILDRTQINKNFDLFEGMTSISALIGAILNGNNPRKIHKILYNSNNLEKKKREISFLTYRSKEMGFELVSATSNEIDALAFGKTHGGFVAIVSKREFSAPNPENLVNGGFYALIDGIEDPYNFGYCVRSLYASGADGLILPQRNWMNVSGTVARSSAGTSELLNIFVDDPENVVNLFKNLGFKIICAEIKNSVSIYDADLTGSVLFVIGGEKRGISSRILKNADMNVRIDYDRDFHGSLPTASAVSVISFHASHMRNMSKNTKNL